MPSDSGERLPTRPHQGGAPPPEPEHLPCPRCDSTNTKFCYYNNYNFSQPRHFCKSCRRYWTHGGTLRDIPVGGGSRKNAKRSRATIATATSSSASAPATQDHHHVFVPTGTPVLLPFSVTDHGGSIPCVGDAKPGLNVCGGFTSFLSNPAPGPGFLAVAGFGLGLGPEFEDMGFGLGRAVWPFQGVGDGGAGGGGSGSGGASMIGNTWQLESGEYGCINRDCFSLPDLAISTPAGNGLK